MAGRYIAVVLVQLVACAVVSRDGSDRIDDVADVEIEQAVAVEVGGRDDLRVVLAALDAQLSRTHAGDRRIDVAPPAVTREL